MDNYTIASEQQQDSKQTDWRECCVHELFELQAQKTPNSVAVQFGKQTITYLELNRRANRLAHQLRKCGVRTETLCGFLVNRSPDMIIGLLATLKAGGAYVPLDPGLPQDSIKFMLNDGQISILLTQKNLASKLDTHSGETVFIDGDWDDSSSANDQNLQCDASPDSLAYVMYTSGSTGEPKGSRIVHRGVTRLVKDTNYVTLNADEVFLQFAPFAFDASTFEVWGCLLNGGKLVIFPDSMASTAELGRFIRDHKITTLWLTAGLFHLMVDERLEDLTSARQILAGGDVLSVKHVKKAIQELVDCTIINGYGPTENTTFTCCYPMTDVSQVGDSVPIGKPISNTQAYVLDADLKEVAIGETGELYTGGHGLARDYLNRPELTKEKFVPNPFSDAPDSRLYRTGDLVRYLPDGNLEFIGRLDTQVKIRGFRIELEGIEATLAKHPDVRQSVVVAREDIPGDKRLIAYIVQKTEQQFQSSEVRLFLEQKLPSYMVPSILIQVDELPLTTNGKVDRRSLPDPDIRPDFAQSYMAPKNQLEVGLTRVWGDLLELYPIGTKDDFFEDLGGHSLLALKMVSEIEKYLDKKVPLSAVFENPTIEELGRILDDEDYAGRCLLPLKTVGSRPPLFLFQGFEIYRQLAARLSPDQPVYGLSVEMLEEGTESLYSLEEMVSKYIREMDEVNSGQPYLLGGLSFGGIVALEVAQQLTQRGETVAFVGLLDTSGKHPYKRYPTWKRFAGHWNNVRESWLVLRWF